MLMEFWFDRRFEGDGGNLAAVSVSFEIGIDLMACIVVRDLVSICGLKVGYATGNMCLC